MATFPKEEANILTLGQEMSAGLKANSETFPAPPVNALDLDAALSDFVAERDAAVAAQSAAVEATDNKQTALQNLSDRIKSNIRYAEQAVDFDDAKLKTIGWGGRRDPKPLEAPGRAQDLVSGEQGEGSIELKWQKPISGGKVSAYEIRRRNEENRAEGWDVVKTSLSTEITLTGQPRGVQLEYVVVAMNKAGDGPVSNPVMAVL